MVHGRRLTTYAFCVDLDGRVPALKFNLLLQLLSLYVCELRLRACGTSALQGTHVRLNNNKIVVSKRFLVFLSSKLFAFAQKLFFKGPLVKIFGDGSFLDDVWRWVRLEHAALCTSPGVTADFVGCHFSVCRLVSRF